MLERLEINDAEAIRFLQSPEVAADLLRRAESIKSAAGDGAFDVTESMTPTRARVSIGTADYKARKGEAEKRSLTRALDAGRG